MDRQAAEFQVRRLPERSAQRKLEILGQRRQDAWALCAIGVRMREPLIPEPRCRSGFGRCSCVAIPELARLVISPLNRSGVEHLITGSVAAAMYAEPRLTYGVDTART